MANFKKLTFTQNTDALIKKTATVSFRRYLRIGRKPHITVELFSGWCMQSPTCVIVGSAEEARNLILNHIK